MGKEEGEESGFGFKDRAKAEETLRLLQQHEPNYRRLTVRGLLGRARRVLAMTKAEEKIRNIKEAMEVFETWLADLDKDKTNKKTDKQTKEDKSDHEKKEESNSDVEMEEEKKETKEKKKELPPDTVPGLGFKDKEAAERTLRELEGRDPDYQRLAVKGLLGRAKRVLTCTRDETKLANIKQAMSIFEKYLEEFETQHRAAHNCPYLPLALVRTAALRARSDVTATQKSFIEAYASVNGEYKRLRTVAAQHGKTWDIVRNAALAELKEKYADTKLFNEKDEPTKEHLEMLLWAYSPEAARVKKLLPETKESKDESDNQEEKKESDSADRKRRHSNDEESPSKKKKE